MNMNTKKKTFFLEVHNKLQVKPQVYFSFEVKA